MNTDRHPGTTGGDAGMGRRTEGTAVFLGRSSFRMIPAREDRVASQQERSHVEATAQVGTSHPFVDVEPKEKDEESVVLSPPHTVGRDKPGAVRGSLAKVVSAPDGVRSTETIKFGGASREGPRSQRRAVPLWAVAAALLLGASVTLSAQAVMRGPGQFATAIATIPATSAPQATAIAPAVVLAPVVPVAVVPAPLVALSTATLLSQHVAPTNLAPRRTAAVERIHQARAAHAATRSTYTAAARPTQRGPVKWVDPFVARPTTRVSGPTVAASDPAVAKTGGRNTWVDPFAN
jgi:hypothetical protein